MGEDFDITNERLLGAWTERQRGRTWAMLRGKYRLSDDAVYEIYQKSCIALFQNIRNGKLVHLSSTLSTYFNRICINQALKYFRDSKHERTETDSIDDEGNYEASKISNIIDEDDDRLTEEQISAMHSIVAKLPPPCEGVLWAYFQGWTMEEIAEEFHYKNAQTAKAKRFQCFQKLVNTYKEKLKAAVYGTK